MSTEPEEATTPAEGDHGKGEPEEGRPESINKRKEFEELRKKQKEAKRRKKKKGESEDESEEEEEEESVGDDEEEDDDADEDQKDRADKTKESEGSERTPTGRRGSIGSSNLGSTCGSLSSGRSSRRSVGAPPEVEGVVNPDALLTKKGKDKKSGVKEEKDSKPCAVRTSVEGVYGKLVVAALPNSESLRAVTKEGTPMIWTLQYARADKGSEVSWLFGPLKFRKADRIAQYVDTWRADYGSAFSLAGFFDKFAEFAKDRPGCFVSKTDPMSPHGHWCPLPGVRWERVVGVGVRAATNPEMGGTVNPATVRVSFKVVSGGGAIPVITSKTKKTEGAKLEKRTKEEVAFLTFGVWCDSGEAASSLVRAWDQHYPKVTTLKVVDFMRQLRMPDLSVGSVAKWADVKEMARQAVYDPPAVPPVEQAGPRGRAG